MQTVRVHTRQDGHSRSRTLLTALIPLLVLLAVQAGALPTVEQVEPALLKGDWPALVELLKDVTPQTPSPVLRLIKGHACLATNRNNESSCLILSASNVEDRTAWLTWADSLTTKYPGNSFATYLLGDALGRSENYKRAVSVLKQGIQDIKTCPSPALRLNAMGVFYALQGNLDEARNCFEEAISSSNARLADSYANLGMYWIQRSEGAEGAEKAFDKALSLSPNFALALHGRGCARLVGNKTTARKDMEDALAQSGCLEEVMLENVVRCAARIAGADADLILAEARESGTMLERTYTIDELHASANRWTSTAEAFGKASWLPFNQHLQKFSENRVVERMEGMEKNGGMAAVGDFLKTQSINPSLAVESVNRVAAFNNEKTQAIESGVKDLGSLASVASIFVNHPVAKPALAVGGKAAEIAGKETLESSRIHNGFGQRFNESGFSTNSFAPNSVSGRISGGVDLSLDQINWDEGDWPFLPLYGLTCGTPAAASTK